MISKSLCLAKNKNNPDIKGEKNNQTKNVPHWIPQNVPLSEKIQQQEPNQKNVRLYIKKKDIEDLGKENGREGISITDLILRFSCSKEKAQRTLKHFHAQQILFTARDLLTEGIQIPNFKDSKPQRYYLTSLRSQIIELSKKDIQNALIDTTVLQRFHGSKSIYQDPSSPAYWTDNDQLKKASIFIDILEKAKLSPLQIHKIQILLHIPTEYYEDLTRHDKYKEDAKHKKPLIGEYYIGNRHAGYHFYPNGTVQIYITCSKTPFNIENEHDVNLLYAFFGEVHFGLTTLMNDYRERHAPPVDDWIIKNYDLNRDVPIDNLLQLSMPSMQFKYHGLVFRAYVKSLSSIPVFRVEQSVTSNNKRLHDILWETIHPEINQKLDSIDMKLQIIKNSIDKNKKSEE